MPEEDAVVVQRSAWVEMAAHAQLEAPREAVGILGGAAFGVVDQIFPLTNIAGPLEFFADPYDQFQAERSICMGGSIGVGYYHSHPGGGVNLSNSDRFFAQRRDWVYLLLITNLLGTRPVSGAAFRYIGEELKRVSLVPQSF